MCAQIQDPAPEGRNTFAGSETPNKHCRYCAELIQADARVCPKCHRHQSRFWHHFGSLTTLISITMVMIALAQLWLASGERAGANRALTQAEKALKDAQETQKEVSKLRSLVKGEVLAFAGVTYLFAETRNEFGTARSQAALKEAEHLLNDLLESVLEDTGERERWVRQLRSKLPPKQ